MIAALVLAASWAQAEPAPPPPAPPPAAPPPAALPPAALPPPPALANGLAVLGRFAYRLGSAGQSLGPAAGFSLGGSFEHRYLAIPDALELGAAVDFFYDRFATGVVGSSMVAPGVEQTFAGTRMLSETSFALLQTVAWRAGPLRPFVAAGVGASIAYFSSPELNLRPGSMDAVRPLVRVAAGIDIAVSATAAVVIRADTTHGFTRPTYTTNQLVTYSLLGDLFDVGAGMLVRF